MKYLSYILVGFIISLTYIFFSYDFIIHSVLFSVLFCFIYYGVNAYVILNTIKKTKLGNILVMVLSLNYAICCYSESFLLGVPLLFLIVAIFIMNYHCVIKIIVNSVFGVLIISFLVFTAIAPSINRQEINKVYNSNGDIAVISISIDTGATGISYQYQAEKELISSLIRIRKTLISSKKYDEVQWLDYNSVLLGDVQYNIWLP